MLIIIFVCFLGTYIPRKEVEVTETIRATIIKPNEAIKLRARGETKVPYLTLKLDGFLAVYLHSPHKSIAQADPKWRPMKQVFHRLTKSTASI